jgi:uncharacterized membrane protein
MGMFPTFMKRSHVQLLLVMVIALLLRCINLAHWSVQYDDAFSYFLARQSFANIIAGTAADTMPPLYYFLLHFWMKISQGIWFLRSLSVLLSLGIVVFLYAIISTCAGEAAGLWAALLAAISPLEIYHAQDVRMYALVAFCLMGYCYCFVRLNKDSSAKFGWWAGLVLFGVAAMYSHNLAGFVIIVPDLYLLITKKFRLLVKLLVAQVIIGVAFIPWLFFVPNQIAKIQQAFWTPRPGIVEVLQAIVMLSANLPLAGIWFYVGAILSIQVFVIVMIELVRNKNGLLTDQLLLVLLAFVPPILLFIVSYIMRPVFVARGFLASTVIYDGIAGIVIARSTPKGVGYLLLGAAVLATGVTFPYQYTFSEFPRSPYQSMVSSLQESMSAGSLVLHDNKLSFFPSYYYAPQLEQAFLPDVPGSSNDTFAPATQAAIGLYPAKDVQKATLGKDNVYFVVYQETLDEYAQQGTSDPALDWLSASFNAAGTTKFNDLVVYHFLKQTP